LRYIEKWLDKYCLAKEIARPYAYLYVFTSRFLKDFGLEKLTSVNDVFEQAGPNLKEHLQADDADLAQETRHCEVFAGLMSAALQSLLENPLWGTFEEALAEKGKHICFNNLKLAKHLNFIFRFGTKIQK
jgi:hypothetical protein